MDALAENCFQKSSLIQDLNSGGVFLHLRGGEKRNVVTNEAACGVITVFSDVKVCKSSSPEDVKQHKKKVLFCLSEDTNLMLEEGGSCWWVKTSDDATPLLSRGCHTRM
ncbi:hypothetical protein E5288_WYG007186 [Bos mutus]|uniref:Uncharacterized protein n=1 Tax=Bos mutus TaxID=72004 RepID=A0A6B0QQI6_9CETA|nr:hypothetical protein [Bos mutus]